MEDDGMEQEGLDLGDADAQDIYGELGQLFSDFVEGEMSSPNSDLRQVYSEIALDGAVSDINMKIVKGIANSSAPLSSDDMFLLAGVAGKDSSGFSPLCCGEGDDGGATEEQLEGYAEHLRNYLYTYKDEAAGIDPTIDPDEEHVGPMAQDIEKVAPDCVKETPEGVKTVDGSRLALVNAGVIGELARRVLELEEKVNGRV